MVHYLYVSMFFDHILLNKLLSVDFDVSTYNWFNSYLSGRVQAVITDWFKLISQKADKVFLKDRH